MAAARAARTVLVVLWAGFMLASVCALVAIVITGRYPRAVRLRPRDDAAQLAGGFHAYSALDIDRYSPFSLGEEPDYLARLDIAYPAHLSRGLALVKWWLLAIPHYFVLAITGSHLRPLFDVGGDEPHGPANPRPVNTPGPAEHPTTA